jgi:hypothetical protein
MVSRPFASPTNLTLGFLAPNQAYQVQVWIDSDNGKTLAANVTFRTLATEAIGTEEPTIRPGTFVGTCTLGFILRDATGQSLYALTAGHCFNRGDEVHRQEYEPPVAQVRELVGRVVASHDGSMGPDWALVEIAQESKRLVAPSMWHWGGPVTAWGPTNASDTVCHFGWGQAFSLGTGTNGRCGEFKGYGNATVADESGVSNLDFMMSGLPWSGDSGSPVIDGSGAAVGILVEGLPGEAHGMTLCGILALASQEGFDLALMTAPLSNEPMASNLPPGLPFLYDLQPNGSCSLELLSRHALL